MNALTDIKTEKGTIDGVSVVSNLLRLVHGKHHVILVPNDVERTYLRDTCGLKEETGNVSAQSEYELSQCLALLDYLDVTLTGRVNALFAL